MRFSFFKTRNQEPAPIVYQYWHGDPPHDIATWMMSWRGVEPEFGLKQFDDATAAKFIAEQIGPEAEAIYLQCRAPAMRSDFFRYCALYASGGVYVDAGTSYRGGLADLYARGSRGVLLRRMRGSDAKLINGFMIAKRAADPLMKFAMESAIANIRDRKSQIVWDATGPAILRRAYASDRRLELFSGFEILNMHSIPVKRVFVFLRRENKIGSLDWRAMRDANETIYLERTDRPEAEDDQAPVPIVKAAPAGNGKQRPTGTHPARKIAFMHIPKSGGVSIEHALKSRFSAEEIAPFYFPHEYAKVAETADLSPYRLIIGHFDYDLIRQLDPTFVRAVLFREPLQLVVSLYNHAASRPAHRLYGAISSGELPFEKFCRGVGGASNILSKYLLGRSTYFKLMSNGPNDRAIGNGVDIALEHLEKFDCIGILDEMDRFGRTLSSAAGVEVLEIPKLNSSEPKRVTNHDLAPAEQRSLEDANRLDLAIYDAVKKSYTAGNWCWGKEGLP